ERRRGFDKLVVASSMSVYGEGSYFCKVCGTQEVPLRAYPQTPWNHTCRYCLSTLLPRATFEEKPLRPTSVYAVTKRNQEELCLAVGGAYRIPTTALRFFNVYGPGQALSNPYTGAVAIFASRLLNGQPPLLFEDGEQTRDFVHVSDVARAIVTALDDHSEMQDVWNVGTGVATSMLTLASRLADLMGGPQPEIIGKGRAGDIRHCYADIEKAKRKGFTAQVRLAEGLRDLVPYLRKQCPVDGALRAKEELEVRGLVA
ncbi:MAG TPA: NAD-dependent epimerase/dehydratase family protein, partial [Gemmatimonadales bacterium]|nr:NAD-dependent epimerase/dehydratase family protein [Gemmatimonadales bacterium]